MGLIANYSCLSDANLKELKAMGSEEEEILESVEEWNDDDELLLDIDKMWDVLHACFYGRRQGQNRADEVVRLSLFETAPS